ncbi:MAG: hypothetical protein EON98_12135 [Chitinophagaceae bacterium]|nr:MAG: hypothetical protein EON98_12135 [Chitinophagaceae bacterium]
MEFIGSRFLKAKQMLFSMFVIASITSQLQNLFGGFMRYIRFAAHTVIFAKLDTIWLNSNIATVIRTGVILTNA